MKTKPNLPHAIIVGVQLPGVDDVAHAASIEELGRLVKTLGYEVVGTISQKRDELLMGALGAAQAQKAVGQDAGFEKGIEVSFDKLRYPLR